MYIKSQFEEAEKILKEFISNEKNFINVENAGKIIMNSINKGGKVFSCGNGGSMCDAMHFAEELTGSFREKRKAIPAIAISDSAHITCTANDFGWDFIFSRYLEAIANKDDILLVISTSGNSRNIIEAAKTAKGKGMCIIGLTGKDGGLLKDLCDVEIRAPHSKYSDRTQEIHIKVIHSLIYYIENNL
jgi:D-sedoheptulose 7-phosphate isomerase